MSATPTAAPRAGAAAPAARPDVRPISMIERIGTELRKLTDFRGGRILIWVTIALEVLFGLGLTAASGEPVPVVSVITMALFPLVYLIPVLGIIMTTDEWRQKTVMVTYAQDSNRTGVFIAKIIALAILTLLYFVVAIIIGLVVAPLFGAPVSGIADLPAALPVILTALGLAVLVGAGLGGATLSLGLGLVLMFVGGQAVAPILRQLPATSEFAGYLDFFSPLQTMLMGIAWPPEVTKAIVAFALWTVVPLAIAVWRNGTKDIS